MEIDTGTTELLCSVRDGVALITLNRPEARNAMSDRLTPATPTVPEPETPREEPVETETENTGANGGKRRKRR